MPVEIREIDYARRIVVTSDARRLPIADLFDRAGLTTLESHAAVLCVAGRPGAWLCFRLRDFERRQLQ